MSLENMDLEGLEETLNSAFERAVTERKEQLRVEKDQKAEELAEILYSLIGRINEEKDAVYIVIKGNNNRITIRRMSVELRLAEGEPKGVGLDGQSREDKILSIKGFLKQYEKEITGIIEGVKEHPNKMQVFF